MVESGRRPIGGEILISPMQTKVLDGLAGNRTVGRIARDLGVDIKTVGKHKERLFKRLEVHSVVQAVIKADKLSLIDIQKYTKELDLSNYKELSEREKSVLSIMADEGCRQQDAAAKLNISKKAINNIMGGIYSKLEVNSCLQASLIFLAVQKREQTLKKV